jgi:hypothetical protein
MKSLRLLAAALVLFASALLGQPTDPTPRSAVEADVQNEVRTIADAHRAAKADDDAKVDRHLGAAPAEVRKESASVTLARRAAGVCGWLRSEGDYGRAMAVARRTLKALAPLKERSDADRVERLYWEAFLAGEILDYRMRALELLQEAEKLAPDDDRILEAAQRWAATLAEFGESPAGKEASK